MRDIREDISVTIYFTPSNVTSYSAGSAMALNNFALECETDIDQDGLASDAFLSREVSSFNIPYVFVIDNSPVYLSHGTTSRIKLDGIRDQKIVHLFVVVRHLGGIHSVNGYLNVMWS